jgi:hypothetical protein
MMANTQMTTVTLSNITTYLEAYKNSILHLTEKHDESVVEALTNNAINTTAASSTPTLSSPQCSCTFPNLANQNDIHRKEESEIYDNCKGDILD